MNSSVLFVFLIITSQYTNGDVVKKKGQNRTETGKPIDPTTVLPKVEKGIEAAKEIMSIFEASSTSKFITTLGKVSKAIGPFLGALGPVLSLVTLFLPKSTDPNMKNITNEFAEIDGQFDKVFNKFGEIGDLIKKKAIMTQYSKYENEIHHAFRKLESLMKAEKATVNARKDKLIKASGPKIDLALHTLYDSVARVHGRKLSDFIPNAVMDYTNYHRKKVQNMMKGMLNIITQGAKAHIAYQKIMAEQNASYNAEYESEKKIWKDNVQKVVDEIIAVDTKVKNQYITQHTIDFKKVAVANRGKSNADVAKVIYEMLVEKYDWRTWLVLVYDKSPEWTPKDHKVGYCGGSSVYEYHGKNIEVSSYYDTNAFLDKYAAKQAIDSIPMYKRIGPVRKPPLITKVAFFSASELYDKLYRVRGQPVCGVGVVKTTLNPQLKGDPRHFFAKTRGNFKMYMYM